MHGALYAAQGRALKGWAIFGLGIGLGVRAAGTLAATRLILGHNGHCGRQLRLLSNPTFALAFLMPGALGRPLAGSGFALGQLGFLVDGENDRVADFAAFCRATGNDLVESGEDSGVFSFLIRKAP